MNPIPTLDTIKRWLDAELATIIPEAPQRIAERNLLLRHFLAISPEMLYADPQQPITQSDRLSRLREALYQRLEARTPVQYLIGEAVFYGLSLRVAPDVLIPRPETEHLVEAAIAFCRTHPVASALDLGTGSGCIAIAFKQACPHVAVTAVDYSPPALVIARENAARHQLDIRFLQGNWFEPVTAERFDLILSNPPYILPADRQTLTPEVLTEPASALFVPETVEALYQQLLNGAQSHLSPQGRLWMEFGRASPKR